MTRIEMWMEGGKSHLRVTTDPNAEFSDVELELIAMRDRLDREIKSGPKICPYAPKVE